MDISRHPVDLALLSPGHFLALTELPELRAVVVRLTSTKRFDMLTRMRDDFWRRWKAEYLAALQACPRWCASRANSEVGSLILIKDEKPPPAKLPLARVHLVSIGLDGKVYAAFVRRRNCHPGSSGLRQLHNKYTGV